MNKLFERINDYKIDDTGLPIEDPNMLGDMDFNIDTVKQLNWMAEQAAERNNKAAEVIELLNGVQNASTQQGISPLTASVTYTALEGLLRHTEVGVNYPSLESFIDGNNTIPTAYAIESFIDTVKELHGEFKQKFTVLVDKAKDFHEKVITKTGRTEEAAKKLLEELNNIDGHPKQQRIELSPRIGRFLNQTNNVGNMHSMISVIKSGHFSAGAGDAWSQRLSVLKGQTLRDRDGVIAMSEAIEGNPIDLFVTDLTKHDFSVISDLSKENEESKSGVIVLRSNHGLMGKVFMTITLQHVKHEYISSSTLSFITTDKFKSIQKVEEFPALSVDEQRKILQNVIQLCRVVREGGDETKRMEKKMTEVSKELVRVYNEFSKGGEEVRHIEEYRHVRNYIYSLFNCMWLVVGPSNLVADNAMKVADALLIYVNKSMRNIHNESNFD
jgi:predicted RNA-binding protein YlqC (UPF0109 family)